jgi:hypothetical protein
MLPWSFAEDAAAEKHLAQFHDVIKLPVTLFKCLSSANRMTENWDALMSSGAAVQSGANASPHCPTTP